MLLRAFLLKRWTTKQIEDDISAPDMELIMGLWDLLENVDDRKLSKAVNRGMWGDK